MNIYLDLSFFINFVLHLFCLFYLNLIYEKVIKLNKMLTIAFLNSILVFLLPFFKLPLFVNLIYLVITLFLFLPKREKFYLIFNYLIILYLLEGSLNLMSRNIILDNYSLIVVNPLSTLKVFLLIIPLIIIYVFSLIINYKLKIQLFKMDVKIIINHKVYKLRGYFDSGNTLLKNGYPVIFIKECFLNKEDLTIYDKVSYLTLKRKRITSNGYLATIKYHKYYFEKEKEIIFLLVSNEHYFNNCDCLLNAYI